jgi:DnaJ-domain-containing protein 1
VGFSRSSLVVWMIVIAQPARAARAAAVQAPPDSSAPTPIEQALIDHDCGLQRITASDTVYDACAAGRLASLRADFGRDLKGLSAAERRSIDVTCSRVRIAEGRDAYVSCVGAQLAALRAKRAHGQPAAADTAPASSAPTTAPAVETPRPRSRWSTIGWIGGGLLLVAAAAAVYVLKFRRPVRCRVCGAILREAGELCPVCRHEAADAARRASLERATEARTRDDHARRLRELEETQRREQAKRLEDEQAQHEERLRREAQAREEAEAARRQEDEARRRRETGSTSAALDPYALLGVAPEAGADAIEAAYRAAKAKYAPEEVEHLGDDAQAFYREKSAAIERAYQTIIDTPSTASR